MIHGTTRAYRTPAGKLSFEFSIELGRGPDGKRRQSRRRGFPTEAAARAAMEDELVQRRRGEHVDPSRQPLADYLRDWLDVTAPQRAPATNATAAVNVKRIAAGLGHVPLAHLQPQQIQRWLNDLSGRYAPTTLAITRATLAQALAQAVEWRLIARNPAKGVRLPRAAAPEERPAARAWTAEQARAFLAAADGSEFEALWRVLLDGQLRAGEARALRWADLDLDAALVRVRRTVTRDERHREVIGDRPKTPRSRRDVAVAPDTVAALRRHRAAQNARRLEIGPAWRDNGLVFANRSGGLLYRHVIDPALDALCAAAGVPAIGCHGLRHTGATLLLLAGVPAKVVSERLGHSGIAITLDIYIHISPEADRSAAETLAALLSETG